VVTLPTAQGETTVTVKREQEQFTPEFGYES
jgi:hypothetical protein